MSIERQELHCHDCGRYVQFDIDTGLNGNHVLECPNCGHEHCRVVKDGQITEDRWDRRNPTHQVTTASMTTTSVSTYDTYLSSGTSTSGTFLYNSWLNAACSA